MSVAAVAFVPAAPLLVPQVAGGSASLDDALRAATLGVVARGVDTHPADVVVVAPAGSPGEWPSDATWDFAGFGVRRRPADPRPRLPWPLGIGGWLLDECGWDGPRRYLDAATGVDSGLEDRTTLIIAVGDGSACRTERAPGHLDPRAEPFDDEIAGFLARGDATGLGGVEEVVADGLLCGGLPVWRWVTSALAGAVVREAELVTHVAPYGVGYFVALWSLG